MKMKQAVKWCSDALARRAIVEHMTHYRVTKGRLWATDGNLTASYPVECDLDFLVPGKVFEKALGAIDGEPEITIDGNFLRLRHRGFKARIPTMDQHDFFLPPAAPKSAWSPAPVELIPHLRMLLPFASTDASRIAFTCIAARKGFLYATNNRTLVRVPTQVPDLSILLPRWAVEFILEHEKGLTSWALSDNNIQVAWSDGGWMRAQLVVGEFPDAVDDMMRDAGKQKMTQDIYTDWLETLQRVAGLTEGNLHLRADSVIGLNGQVIIEDAAENVLPAGAKETIWKAEDLIRVAQVAEEWNPAAWPKPAAFKGPDGLIGLISGSTSE